MFGMVSVDSPTRYRFNITGEVFSLPRICVPFSLPASPGTGLVIYKPLQNVTTYEGDTNVQFSIVASDFNDSSVYCRITTPPGSSLKSTRPFPSCEGCLAISGPVSLVDSGTVVTCDVCSSAGVTLYTATLTVLGE